MLRSPGITRKPLLCVRHPARRFTHFLMFLQFFHHACKVGVMLPISQMKNSRLKDQVY